MKVNYSIASYRAAHYVIPDENRLVPDAVIACYSKSDVDAVAVLHFFKVTDDKRSSPLGIFLESDGRIRMTLRLDRYAQIIDLLRHESPVRVWADEGNDGLVYGGLYTSAEEPLGEGDVDHTKDWLTGYLSDAVKR